MDRGRPTRRGVHPVYIASSIFQTQFADAHLRRFNLVTLDLRSHGETGGKVTKSYGQEEAADDVIKFMEELRLPPSYFFGLSMGTIIALEIAVTFPQKVLGLFLVSPLGLEEPPEVAEGRQEIHDCWVEAFNTATGEVDQAALMDSVNGALQLGFNEMSQESGLVKALVTQILPFVIKNWGPKNNGLEAAHITSVQFFVERKAHSEEVLGRIKAPIKLIHFEGDIAYPPEYTEEFFQKLSNAGVDVSMDKFEGGSHFGCVLNHEKVNLVLHDFVMAHTSSVVPPPPQHVISPFEAGLVKAGWSKDDSDDED